MEGVYHIKMREAVRTGQCADTNIATVELSCGFSGLCFFFEIDTCMSKTHIQLLDSQNLIQETFFGQTVIMILE